MKHKLPKASLDRLWGVNPSLVAVVMRASLISPVPFIVTEGLRTLERQIALKKAGASRTLKSKHLDGRAVDLAAVIDGRARWDWPLYAKIAKAMKSAAAELGVHIRWGGDWTTFKDGPHFELKSKG